MLDADDIKNILRKVGYYPAYVIHAPTILRGVGNIKNILRKVGNYRKYIKKGRKLS